jgi:hypothetical protein
MFYFICFALKYKEEILQALIERDRKTDIDG